MHSAQCTVHLNFFRHKGEEETDMKERDGKDGGPGEDSTLLEGKEENPEKVTPMPMPVWKKNLSNEFVVCPLGEILLC